MRGIKISASCHIGNIRDYNDDMILVVDKYIRDDRLNMDISLPDTNRFVVALADGLGGYHAGDVASAETLSNLKYFISDLPCFLSADRLKELLNDWLYSINKVISSQGYVNPQLSNMGTTLVGIIRYEDKFFWINCGDSRLYRLRNKSIMQITKDHSNSSMNGNERIKAVTNCIGSGCRAPFFDINEFTCDKDDIYLLCSDGLSDMLQDVEIKDILIDDGDSEDLCRAAINAGGYDNVSACVMKIV